jgi:hypothetical protein
MRYSRTRARWTCRSSPSMRVRWASMDQCSTDVYRQVGMLRGSTRGLADGAAAGVEGTPGFVIGRTKTGDTVEGAPIRGAQPLDTFRQIIEQLLAR